MHYNLIVKILNDRFGIQTRGGCSCAGTYGHILLKVNHEQSRSITSKIDHGDLSEKPGWVRVSVHPTMTDAEAIYIAEAIHQTVKHGEEWAKEYHFELSSAEFIHKTFKDKIPVNLNTIKF